MRVNQLILSLIALVGFAAPTALWAKEGPDRGRPAMTASQQQQIDFRAACDNATAQTDMDVNNVRARLTTGGDVWWNGSAGRYVVPKVPTGVDEVSSIFAGAVWLGGKDPGGGLKVAAQQYGRGSGNFDFYTGPLTDEGLTSKDTCARWDRFFTVSGEAIRELRAAYELVREDPNGRLDPSTLPDEILGWPATGNQYFFDVHRFELPNTTQGLAGFWDEDLDGIYDPTLGDYPIIEIRGCGETPQFPEEMTFWIYNDAGNTHRESNIPQQIQMEVQVQAFAYTTSDDINSMTFQRYKLINRATEDIFDTYFAMWVDADLGCSQDDYVGTDTTRSLAYVYNSDVLDGIGTGCDCDGANTYCDEIPILGVDYFRGPRKPIFDEDGNQIGEEELGMSSFITIYNSSPGSPDPGTTDPNTAQEYYNYLQGRWLDGSTLQNTGDGYDEAGAEETRYVFSDAPNVTNGFNMVTADLGPRDPRTLQASGPFTLQPGAVNELIIGVVWVPDQTYPNPSIQRLQQADDLAQSLFDNCFDICDGPDAPDVDVIELDREVILLLSNNIASNNYEEAYVEPGLGVPEGFDSLYRFEGYRVYQFSGPNVSLAEEGNVERVREIAQFDLNNGITKVFNWNPINEDDNPLLEPYLAPELVATGTDNGIRHSLRITQDAFASSGDTRLINHRRYYFTVVAYGYNNYKEYDPLNTDLPGQPQQYKASSRNIGDNLTGSPFYQVIPRPILDRQLMADYGDGAIVTRIAGEGNNGTFLDINDETREEMENAFAAGETVFPEITYETGAAPIDVFVVNPLGVVDGDYELTFVDADMSDENFDEPVNWILRNLSDPGAMTVMSERPISQRNEQIIGEYGFSVNIGDVEEPSDPALAEQGNGVIGGSISYDDPDGDKWLGFLPDGLDIGLNLPVQLRDELFNYVNNGVMEQFEEDDPNQDFNNLFPGIYPYRLMNWEERASGFPFFSPVWLNRTNGTANTRMSLEDLTNVDIVLTSNKDLWSRCPVIETSNIFYEDAIINGTPVKTDDDRPMFDTRDAPSVTKNAGSDGLPEVDTDIDPAMETGMGWFPGYAVDVETGQRLEIFWGENSLYDGRSIGSGDFTAQSNGNDMIWNPSDVILEPVPESDLNAYTFVGGGQHYFYVTKLPYDGGEYLESRLNPHPSASRKVNGIREIIWAGFPLLSPGSELLSYEDGIVPNDATIKLRVNNKYDFREGTEDATGYPTYRFSIDGKAADDNDAAANERELDMINIVPNPYYGFSSYEDSALETIVKITNLPAKATVTIYSLDGKFIRKYERDEAPTALRRSDSRPIGTRQVTPALEWDLKNFKQIPVSGGVYLIHVEAPGLGERTLKFFGVQRQFDPTGL
ncbi:hypothetical protein FUA23_01615 [Neolewinella aurantiaca]|uniref:T9SS C-terminal target domain-containing protein n=1 Tax=Neolewinella aurantiaca TaxID=2602767 RepID=A0A5C7FTK7_9BACT|nr:hypothetical protein [Neolewinella aurantiaca]TXF91421.1 hypothetical protein FUA23_01615 [Neolewinella aurantiaca]